MPSIASIDSIYQKLRIDMPGSKSLNAYQISYLEAHKLS